MAGRIPKRFIDDLVARSDVVDVVGRRLTLKKAGKLYKACCPFHHEKTPSFTVNPQKNYYHCFGCGAHGDALHFIMDYDHLDFVEAIETLASEMGLSVPREQMSPQQVAVEQKRQAAVKQGYALLAHAAIWFRQNLRHFPESVAYLKQRGVSAEVARLYAIGYAPAAWQSLQHSDPDTPCQSWLAVGLVNQQDDGRCVDKFRGRIQFPIRDVKGRVVGFGGRIIQSDDKSPKYLNSPDTEFFHKGQLVYGLYEVLQSRQALDRLLVVEGYLDVVALAQAGVMQAVATLGTATTEQQIQLLFKYTDQLVFAFDGDKAGRNAAWKVLPIVLTQLQGQRGVRFFFVPDGDDPDTLVRRVGKDAFLQSMQTESLSVGEWLVQGVSAQTGLSWQQGDDVRRLLQSSLALVNAAGHKAVQYELIQALAKAADMQEWQVERLLGVKTGLAVHRQAQQLKRRQMVELPMVIQGLPKRLMQLKSAFPMLVCPLSSEALTLLQAKASPAMRQLLASLKQVAVMTGVEGALLTEAQAEQEWKDGWQKLYCEAMKAEMERLLQLRVSGAMAPEDEHLLTELGAKLKLCR